MAKDIQTENQIAEQRDDTLNPPVEHYSDPITRNGMAAVGLTVLGTGVAVVGMEIAFPAAIVFGLAAAASGAVWKAVDTFHRPK